MSLSPRVSHSRLLICGIGHIPKTARTWMDAFANDPVVRYTRQTPVRDLAFMGFYNSSTQMHADVFSTRITEEVMAQSRRRLNELFTNYLLRYASARK